jgi:uncharacterized protein (DUF2235 family)
MPDAIAPKVRSVENMVARARAAAQREPGSGACLTCKTVLWVSFFFDGTGNNRKQDFPVKHSNVAALFDAHMEDEDNGVMPFYYEGIGTPFEFKERHEVIRQQYVTRGGVRHVTYEKNGHKESESLINSGFGGGLEQRLEKALFQLEEYIAEMRRQRKVEEINLAAFGFSRGATTARAFMHWLKAHSKVRDAGSSLLWDGITLKVRFLGLFDTVESVGGAGKNTRPEVVKTRIPAFVEKCTHLVAAHELRKAFPLTVLATQRFANVVYPGAHADVGGGYGPADQGRVNWLARLALLQMLDEARGAGLKMKSLGEMRADQLWARRYQPSYDVPAAVHKAFNEYQRHVATPAGPIAQVMESHCKLYRAWIDAGLALEDVSEKRKAWKSDPERRKQLVRMQDLRIDTARTAAGLSGEYIQRGSVPPAVEHLFEHYVHDSFEHFSMIGNTLQSDLSVADYYTNRILLNPQG